jgi:hypothetical protein
MLNKIYQVKQFFLDPPLSNNLHQILASVCCRPVMYFAKVVVFRAAGEGLV